MFPYIYRILIELTNGRMTSGALRKFSQSSMSKSLIPKYMKVYNINQEEIRNELTSFNTLHEFFTRQLKENVRLIDEDIASVVSPVDGVLEDFGQISEDKQVTVKGKVYKMEEMFGDQQTLEKYLGGAYMVLYLSPSHYHRIHSPVRGKLVNRWILGKKSFPVNKWGMKYGKDPLSKNYRVITELETVNGHVAIVKVGAMFVNSIEVTNEASELEKGQEFAYFSFGSTVVLLFEKDTFILEKGKSTPADVIVGERIGYMKNRSQNPPDSK